MSETKHTPGPWAIEDPMGAKDGLTIVQAGLDAYEWEFIAMVCQSDFVDGDHMGRQRFISPKEQEANARLIAAAPDLLEVAKLLVSWLDEEDGAHKLCDKARAAIRKAEGSLT